MPKQPNVPQMQANAMSFFKPPKDMASVIQGTVTKCNHYLGINYQAAYGANKKVAIYLCASTDRQINYSGNIECLSYTLDDGVPVLIAPKYIMQSPYHFQLDIASYYTETNNQEIKRQYIAGLTYCKLDGVFSIARGLFVILPEYTSNSMPAMDGTHILTFNMRAAQTYKVESSCYKLAINDEYYLENNYPKPILPQRINFSEMQLKFFEFPAYLQARQNTYNPACQEQDSVALLQKFKL